MAKIYSLHRRTAMHKTRNGMTIGLALAFATACSARDQAIVKENKSDRGRAAGILEPQVATAMGADSRLPEVDTTNFVPIFDGKTLTGWEGDPTYWHVEDGKLVGEVTPTAPLKRNSWILWRGGLVEDFELVADYRISPRGSSSIGYRCAELEGRPYAVRGPHASIDGGDNWTGMQYEEKGRTFLALRGQRTVIESGQMPHLVAQFADPAELQSIVRKTDWNRYHLIVQGNRMRHIVNGRLMCDVTDRDEANRLHAGLLGMEVHVGPPMKVEYRGILIKPLQKFRGDAGPGKVTVREGQLLTFDNASLMKHFNQQAQLLTAPPPQKPIDGHMKLEVCSKPHFARTGIVNIALIGVSKLPTPGEMVLDLVLIEGARTVRVPRISQELLKQLSIDKTYRFALQWSDAESAYKEVSITPIK